ncbi:hypothetical protein [Halobacillus karajensis]|uniref:Uncharacterized protein n=1 Tax=Halobacillus karajensis TaxID=195088 RepID=A0A024P2Y2_9BACI|nr:hypothetical protein [Halobacillus karajensis]CDQ20031.1 hypothetical protein BN982_02339 [Halobacillus karajensis]CDQ22490.1 hypothetical protein BN983_00699 [Halobacillus karajensis]CDQ28334.1 hypothetical protein BN981_02629 [Halobacillus karajensis]
MDYMAFFLFGFLGCFLIGSILNFLLNMRRRKDWVITLLLSVVLGMLFLPFMAN